MASITLEVMDQDLLSVAGLIEGSWFDPMGLCVNDAFRGQMAQSLQP
jgi:hypothetical protein